MDKRPIGVFDSGLGGLTAVRQLMDQLPGEDIIYFGDTSRVPYGGSSPETVLKYTRQDINFLLQFDIKAIVIACNTATSAAAAALRTEYALPIIGMEPALKPAARLHQDGIVLSLATPGTIAGEKYAHLYALYGQGVESLPCKGLMEFAERGEMDSPGLHAYLDALFAPYAGKKIEAIVLGCTHYVFLRAAIARHFPGVPLIDGNEGTVRQLIRRLDTLGLLAPEGMEGGVALQSSGGEDAIALMEKLLAAPRICTEK